MGKVKKAQPAQDANLQGIFKRKTEKRVLATKKVR